MPYVPCPTTPGGGTCSGAGRCYTNTGSCDCYVGCVIRLPQLPVYRGKSAEFLQLLVQHAMGGLHGKPCTRPILAMRKGSREYIDCACRYTGASCSQCASGYVQSGAACVPLFPLLTLPPAPAPAPSALSGPAGAPAAAESPMQLLVGGSGSGGAPTESAGHRRWSPLFASFQTTSKTADGPGPSLAPAALLPTAEGPAPGLAPGAALQAALAPAGLPLSSVKPAQDMPIMPCYCGACAMSASPVLLVIVLARAPFRSF